MGISWSEFIIVWLAVCIVIDIVLTYINKKSGIKEDFDTDERKAKIKLLNTPYRDGVFYETSIRRATMEKVVALEMVGETMQCEEGKNTVEESCVKDEDDEKDELTELQQETSDIVKMLFG